MTGANKSLTVVKQEKNHICNKHKFKTVDEQLMARKRSQTECTNGVGCWRVARNKCWFKHSLPINVSLQQGQGVQGQQRQGHRIQVQQGQVQRGQVQPGRGQKGQGHQGQGWQGNQRQGQSTAPARPIVGSRRGVSREKPVS